MGAGDEADALAAALVAIGGGSVSVDEVLADHPGRRRVVRVGDAVVKAFATVEREAWRREVTGLAVVARSTDPALAPALVASGRVESVASPTGRLPVLLPEPAWSATAWTEGAPPHQTGPGDEAGVHARLGPWLARLHAIDPTGLRPWPVVDRLHTLLTSPPPEVSSTLVASVARLVEPLLDLVVEDTFVHGDWGTANVLVDDVGSIVAIIDFEDAHLGDPAEDFAWQVLAGADSPQLAAMASTYGSLGPHAVERLVVAGTHLCLEVAGWGLPRHTERGLATLDELVTGRWPAWPDD